MTIAPCDSEGRPQGEMMWRTRQGPPIPLIALQAGADPSEGVALLNQPDGNVAVTLARGVQNFILSAAPTALDEPAQHFVIWLFLDYEATPSLSGVVGGDLSSAVAASTATIAMGLDGEAVANHSSVSVLRDGYRVSLRRAGFPWPLTGPDVVGRWTLLRDHVADAVGLITIEVEPAR